MTKASESRSAASLPDRVENTRDDLDFWIDCLGAPVVVVDRHSLIVSGINKTAAGFFGVAQQTSMQRTMADLVGDEAQQMLSRIWGVAPPGSPSEPFLVKCQISGQIRLLMVHVTRLAVGGDMLRLFTFTDAPPQGSMALAGWQDNFIEIFNWLPLGLEVSTIDDQIQFANSTFMEMFGYNQEEIHDIEDWWRLAYPDPDYRLYAKTLWETSLTKARALNGEIVPFDLDVAVKGGARRTIQFRHRTIGNFNINLYLDVTEERQYSRELKTLSETDPLTGAVNRRRFFDEALYRYEPPVGDDKQVGVLMIDLDHFKKINDTYGHAVGDAVLQQFSARCRETVRGDDIFARIGGEEFALMSSVIDIYQLRIMAERLRFATAAEPFVVDGLILNVTVSVGGALRTEREARVEQTMSRADHALYQAKRAGRDQVIIPD